MSACGAQEEVSAADELYLSTAAPSTATASTARPFANESRDASFSTAPRFDVAQGASPKKLAVDHAEATAAAVGLLLLGDAIVGQPASLKSTDDVTKKRKCSTPASPRDASPPRPKAARTRASPSVPADMQKMPAVETASADDRKMRAVDTASLEPPAETASEPGDDAPSLQMVTNETYFADLIHGMDAEAYSEYARSACGDDASKLAEMIVETTRFHMERCNKQTNLVEMLKAFHSALSPGFAKLINASKLRNAYNNPVFNSSKTLEAPLGPSLHLPPGLMPVNIHQIRSVGQFCCRGAEKCVAVANTVAPEFTSIAFSSTGGTSNTQLCATCNACYEEDGFDPARTFGTKGEFDNYMTFYAARHDFKLTKETGPKVSVGAAKVPRYVAVACNKKSAHRRGSVCSCSFKVMASLKEAANGGQRYCFNILDLTHD